MSERMPPPPDLLRRFTPTPYVFELRMDERCIRIEADDLEVALAVRDACRTRSANDEPVLHWRLIRDSGVPRYGEELAMFATGELKTLLHKSGTLLIADRKRREVFGFIGAGLEMQQLTGDLLPLLMHSAHDELQ